MQHWSCGSTSNTSARKMNKMPINFVTIAILLVIAKERSCDFVCRKQDNEQTYLSNNEDNYYADQSKAILFPCRCQNGAGGLQISCEKTNLALLSQTLRHIEEPIEKLDISDSKIPRLFGPILSAPSHYESLHSGALRELSIRNCQLEFIGPTIDYARDELGRSKRQNNELGSGFVLGSLSQSLESLQLNGNKLQFVPTDSLQTLTNLRILNLANNQISQLDYGTNMANGSSSLARQLVNLTELDLSWNKLSRLTRNEFLRDLSALEWLNLAGNELVKLERNCLNLFGRKLRQLDLSQNKLSSLDRLDFSDLQVLEWLSLAGNQLTTLPRSIFSRNVKLYTLDLSGNKLDDLDTYLFKSVRFLRRLNMSSNAIRELGKNVLASTSRLKWVDLSQNALIQLGPESFKSLDYLESVDLSHNQLVNISSECFQKLSSLELNLSHNKLTKINPLAFHEITNLTRLNLAHNLLQSDSISAQAFERVECQHLDLSHNLIDDLSKLPVSNFTRIQTLTCTHNFLTELNKKSFGQRAPLLELNSLDVSHNDISQISGSILADKLQNLRTLNLSFNSLRRLTANAFGESATLQELDLSNNNLVELVQGSLSGLLALKRLNLRQNRLKKMIQIPQALTHLSLQLNEISQVSWQQQQQLSNLPAPLQLVELHLDNNKIWQMEQKIAPMPMLRTLSLSNNNLSSIPLVAIQDLINLERLNLSWNAIGRVAERSFQQANLRSLCDLDLSGNNLTFVADFAFDGLLQLSALSLAQNKLRELSPLALFNLGRSLRHLNLESNLIAHISPAETQKHKAQQQQQQQLQPHSNFRNQKVYQLNVINRNNLPANATADTNTKLASLLRSPFQDLESLEVIKLASNRISQLNWRSFGRLNSLLELDLSSNLIGKLEAGSLSHLPSLQLLNLRQNLISDIEPNLLGNETQSLRVVDLSFNRLSELREGSFQSLSGHKTPHLNSILLNNNQLSQLSEQTIRELDSLNSLQNLNLSANRLQSIQVDFIRWIRRGILVDLGKQEHHQQQQQQQEAQPETTTLSSNQNNHTDNNITLNNFHCNCDLLPFVSWLEGVRSRNLSYWLLGSESTILQQAPNTKSDEPSEFNSNGQAHKSHHQQLSVKNRKHFLWLIQQYAKSANMLTNLTCQKPKLMFAKRIIDLSSMATRPEMNCDASLLLEADAYKRLRAPVQLNGAQFKPPNLKISWSLLEPAIEVANFVIIRAIFQQEPNLSAIRWNLASTNQFGLIRLTLDRLNYERRSHLFLEAPAELIQPLQRSQKQLLNLQPMDAPEMGQNFNSQFNLICILYEPSVIASPSSQTINSNGNGNERENWSLEEHYSNMELRLQILSQASRRLNGGASRSVSNVLDLLITDVDHVNCLDLRNLLKFKQDQTASLMIEGGASRVGSSANSRRNTSVIHSYFNMSILFASFALILLIR